MPRGLALYFAFYNLCRIHKTLRMSPAMAAGIRIACGPWKILSRELMRMPRLPSRAGRTRSVPPDLDSLIRPSL